MQVTSCPLNSRRSSFSTAVFRSAAVSYSTNLDFVSMRVRGICQGALTQCRRAHVQLQSRRRPIQIDGQSLSGPIHAMLSEVQIQKV